MNGLYSNEFEVKVVKVGTSCPWELYADDLVLIAETLDLLMMKLWKDNIENKSLHVNMGKTKVIICENVLDTVK